MEITCFCGSGIRAVECCQPYLEGCRQPSNPESLMRSRYSAYVTGNIDYLTATWHPDCQASLWRNELIAGQENTDWRDLQIITSAAGKSADEGFVEFIARYYDRQKQHSGFIHERSRFVRADNRWYYIDGIHLRPGRNDLCPCGSGKKYKKCCDG